MKVANVALDGSRYYTSKLCEWLERSRPDIVTLQKTGSKFPTKEVRDIGYVSRCLRGPDRYLGVAVLSHRDLRKKPQVRVCDLPSAGEKPRYLTARFLTVNIGDLWVSSVYAPYGPKCLGPELAIERRVAWIDCLRDHIGKCSYHHRACLLCGDFNVKIRSDGPLDKKDRYYSEDEQIALEKLMYMGFRDLYREAHPNSEDKPGHTRGYDTNPSGTSRLHLVLASESLSQCFRSACVAVDSKPWPRKDAPPLVVNLDGVSV